MKYLIADLVTEFTPKYDNLKSLAEPFKYNGSREADIKISVTDESIEKSMSKVAEGTTVPMMENFLMSGQFNRAAIKYSTMLVHSSALIYNDGAYLFSGNSGVGKSTHTRLLLNLLGDKAHIMNDDKPVVRLYDDRAVAFGTPFDGGSGIALNEAYPLKAIIFIERGESNSVRVPDSKEIIKKLYFQTAHMVSAKTAEKMLNNFDKLFKLTHFYVLTCNMEPEAAQATYNSILENKRE